MAYKEHELGLLIRLRPEEARKVLLDALRAAEGHEERAAGALGIGVRTLDRWVEALDLGRTVAALRSARQRREARARRTSAGKS